MTVPIPTVPWRRRLGGCLLPLCAPLGAQDSWLPADHAPPGRTVSAMAFDSARERLVLFGGDLHADYGSGMVADTWERTGSVWLRGREGPATRRNHASAYDSVRSTLVVFGGVRADGGYSGETWEYDGDQWRRRYPTTNPAARHLHAMTFDRGRGRTVMFGGANGKGQLDDLWEWDGRDWTLRAAGAGPSARDGHAMSYDPATGRSYLFGGGVADDLWAFDGTRWTRHAHSFGPTPRKYAGAAFDEARGRLLVFGGQDQGQVLAEAWEYDGAAWHQIPMTLDVAPRLSPAMAYDASLRRVVMFGGTSYPEDARTWTWDGTRWTSETRGATPAGGGDRLAVATDTARARIVTLLFDQVRGQCVHSEWDGRQWAQRAIAVPSPRVEHAMVYDSARGRIVLFGGHRGVPLADTWEFDGTQWAMASPAVSPPARYSHCLSYDAGRRVVVVHGGAVSIGRVDNDTWEFDGTTWTQRTSPTAPAARQGHAAAYDPVRGTVVMTGGSASRFGIAMSDTWEWNGRDWVRLSDLPLALQHHSMVFDATTSRLLTAGGFGESPAFALAGGVWGAVTTTSMTRRPIMLALDPMQGAPLAFGEARAAGASTFLRGNHHLGVEGSASRANGGCASTSLGLRSPLAPRLGAPFELQVWDRLPVQQPRRHAGLAWMLGRGADLPFGPCRLGVDPTTAVFVPDATNGEAFAAMVLIVPPEAALRRLALRAQAAIVDVASPIGVTFSSGLELTIGG